MSTPNRPLRRINPDPQPRLPVGQLPYPTATEPAPSEDGEPTASHAGDIIDDQPTEQVTTSEKAKPTAATSGDKKIKRDVPPRRDLVTFEDQPGTKKLSNRRKRTRLNKGGMFFNSRDRDIILAIAAHGWLSKEQIAALLHTSPEVRKSLRRLTTHGLLDSKYLGFNNEVLYTATSFGLRKVGAEGFSGTITPRLQTVEHTDAITALHIHMRELIGNNTNRAFITERELQAAATSGHLSPRLLNTNPWTAEYGDFTRWLPSTVTDTGKPVYKRPDGLLISYSDGKAQPPIPVEIERSTKTRSDYYEQAVLMYANAAKDGHIASEVYYFCPSGTGVMKEVQDALKAVYEPNDRFRWPAHLPKVTFKVFDLDTFYIPYSVSRGWIPGKGTEQT